MIAMTDGQVAALMARTRLDPYCLTSPRFLGVVDTNALLSSVENDSRRGSLWQSRLLRMSSGRAAMLYAPDHIYEEMYEKLPIFARRRKMPVEILRARFEERYLPALRFVTVDSTDIVDHRVLAITDLDDVPTGQLGSAVRC